MPGLLPGWRVRRAMASTLAVVVIATVVGAGIARGEEPGTKSTSVPVVDLKPRPLGGDASSKRQAATAPDEKGKSGGGGGGVLSNPIVRTSVALSGVLVLIVGLAMVARAVARKNGSLAVALGGARAPAGIVEVLGRYPLSRGQSLLLIKLDRRILLIGQSHARRRGGAGSLATLADVSDAEDVASILLRVQDAEGEATAAKFRSLLERFDREQDVEVEDVRGAARGSRLRGTRGAGESGDKVELWDDAPSGLRLADIEAAHPNFDGGRAAGRGKRGRA